MKRHSCCLMLLLLTTVAAADEIDGEINVSQIDPYNHLTPGLGGSYRPEFLRFGPFSAGAGLALHISSSFSYDLTDAARLPDSTYKIVGSDTLSWYYFSEWFLESIHFDFFSELRLQVFGDEDAHWQGWLTMTLGAAVNSAARTQYLTNFQTDTTGGDFYVAELRRANIPYAIEYRTDPYISPGFLIGIGNFFVGYRHWFYFDNFEIAKGEPARNLGTLRVGYRFKL